MDEIAKLKAWVEESSYIVFFWRGRRIDREQHPGFQKYGRTV